MFLEFLYSALETPRGIKVATSDPERFRQGLYKARRDAQDPVLDSLSFVVISTTEVWILRRENQGNDATP